MFCLGKSVESIICRSTLLQTSIFTASGWGPVVISTHTDLRVDLLNLRARHRTTNLSHLSLTNWRATPSNFVSILLTKNTRLISVSTNADVWWLSINYTWLNSLCIRNNIYVRFFVGTQRTCFYKCFQAAIRKCPFSSCPYKTPTWPRFRAK